MCKLVRVFLQRIFPLLNKVEHGCTVATIAEARGVVVVGGATGNDVVEFLDWDSKKEWVTISKLNRGRGKAGTTQLRYTMCNHYSDQSYCLMAKYGNI